jgi:hypothetical protein
MKVISLGNSRLEEDPKSRERGFFILEAFRRKSRRAENPQIRFISGTSISPHVKRG